MVTPSAVSPVSSVTTVIEAASGDGAGETQREHLSFNLPVSVVIIIYV